MQEETKNKKWSLGENRLLQKEGDNLSCPKETTKNTSIGL